MTDQFNRDYIKTRTILGIDPKTIYNQLTWVLGSDAPPDREVRKWAQSFREGIVDVNDDPRSSRPISVLTDENIERVREIISDDPHSTYDNITFSQLWPKVKMPNTKITKIKIIWMPNSGAVINDRISE